MVVSMMNIHFGHHYKRLSEIRLWTTHGCHCLSVHSPSATGSGALDVLYRFFSVCSANVLRSSASLEITIYQAKLIPFYDIIIPCFPRILHM